jgi:Fic family protein
LQLKEGYNYLQTVRLRTTKEIARLHGIIFNGFLVDGQEFAGKLRKVNVTFGGLISANTLHWKEVRKGFLDVIKTYYKERAKVYEFERIINYHINYQRVHGFRDGNSRTGRLIMNYQLLQSYYPPLLFKWTKSSTYRASLAKAVNDSKNKNPVLKYFYGNYMSSFNKFWRPLIEAKIIDEMEKLSY